MSNVSISTDSIGALYSGNVKITVNKHKTPIRILNRHNTGTLAFHKYILEAMSTGISDINYRPYGIILWKNDDQDNSKVTQIYKTIFPGVPLTKKPIAAADGTKIFDRDDTSGSYLQYHFLIPESFMNSQRIKHISLCNAKGENYAWVTLEEKDEDGNSVNDGLDLTPGVNIDIVWTLGISSAADQINITKTTNIQGE